MTYYTLPFGNCKRENVDHLLSPYEQVCPSLNHTSSKNYDEKYVGTGLLKVLTRVRESLAANVEYISTCCRSVYVCSAVRTAKPALLAVRDLPKNLFSSL